MQKKISLLLLIQLLGFFSLAQLTRVSANVDTFYYDPKESTGGERYREYIIKDTQPKSANNAGSTAIRQICSNAWTTCASFDSLNQYKMVQLISKVKLGGYTNCTQNAGERSEWQFSDTAGSRVLSIVNIIGWENASSIRMMYVLKYIWEYDPLKKRIYLYPHDWSKYFETAQNRKALYRLLLEDVSADHLIFSVEKEEQ